MSPNIKSKLYYGWVILAALFFINLVLLGIRGNFGVFFKSIETEFELTRAATSSLVSVYWVLTAIFIIVGGWALDRFGPRLLFLLMGLFTGLSMLLSSQCNSAWQLYLTYSLLFAIGSAPWYIVVVMTISRWFDKKRGLAMGISEVGARLGQSAFAPFYAFLILDFSWRMGFIVTGLMALFIVVPLTRILRNDPKEVGLLPDGARSVTLEEKKFKGELETQLTGLSLSQALRTQSYWFLTLLFLLMGFSQGLVITHIVPYATDMNITSIEAATILTINGAIALPTALIAGRISDMKGRKIPIIISTLLRTITCIGLIWARDLWMFYSLAALFGISAGAQGVLFGLFCVDVFGRRHSGKILSPLVMQNSIGMAIGPYVGGLIHDVTNSYAIAFIIAAIGAVIATLLVSLVRVETPMSDFRTA